MDSMIREFALQMLRKLQHKRANGHAKPRKEQEETPDVTMEDIGLPKENGIHAEGQDRVVEKDNTEEEPSVALANDDHDMEGVKEEAMEDGQSPDEDLVQTPYLPERIELPAQKAQVLQHVELLFALSVKVPEFLEE